MTDTTGSTSKGRGRAVAGVLTGVLVFAVLTGIFLMVQSGGDDEPAAGQQQQQQQASATKSADPLSVEPEVKPGTGKVDKIAVTELIAGSGPVVQKGQTITVNYKVISYTTGEPVDSSWERGQPFTSEIGVGRLIPGWDQAVPGLKVGSRVQLDVPAALAYGPEKGDLRFVVDILDAK
ncbi:FKBP-type peptidyl-prolyl cis-trans isomerase [Actinoplanes sp. NPDC024001]|uniref:FKBP-type peptidyl-prolyl cis-trans isomerase n=1 Tax=Actinoplanes sp. NPDC024001 TaxID=3154598 RepID=UPI0033C2AEB7